MPDLTTTLHTDMLAGSTKRSSLAFRVLRAVRREFRSRPIYGMEWGDPDVVDPLKFIRDHFVVPNVKPDHVAVEIGPGGGRWTRYLLGFRKLYVVDYYSELLEELKKNFHEPNMVFIKNNGTDFPSIAAGSVDFVFSFGTFVHLDMPIIDAYLDNIKPLLKPGANVVLQYSDKNKRMAQDNQSFSHNTPELMRQHVVDRGYKILDEDVTTLWHSSVIQFCQEK